MVDQMAMLEKISNLRSPRLNSTFAYNQGSTMVFSKGGFLRLESLSLFLLTNIEEWKVEEGAIPRLYRLHIGSCSKLKTVPVQHVPSLVLGEPMK
ncbi:hypothetical protein C1H46_001489 [Malus baccata]|uniref:NB-ARC domain-containing protein n=1 Tax=Malus baccata TaxID=106549 RepID=A0A540NQF6_MALBA|nr:hypothetical protein C1H46_001489 [Malus baccata]